MIDAGVTVVENHNEVSSSWSLYFHRGNYIGHKNKQEETRKHADMGTEYSVKSFCKLRMWGLKYWLWYLDLDSGAFFIFV